MSKKVNKIVRWQIVLGLQFLASLLLFLFIFKLGALPPMYLALLAGILFVFLGVSFLLMKPSKDKSKSKVREAIGKIVSLLLSVVMIIGTIYIGQGNDALSSITGANEKTNRFNIYALNTSEFETITDLSFYYVGMSKEYDLENHYLEAHNALLNENSKIRVKEYDSYASMIQDFYDGEVSAIYVNQAYDSMIEETNKTFEKDIKIVWSHDIIEQIIDISKNVEVSKSVFTIYISGIDTTGTVSTVSRSDVNMLVTVNPNTKEILMTSIPRDYYVELADKGKKDKLTHAALTGIENSIKTVENFMDIDINYYARVNFTSLIDIVDALGGIEVYSPISFTTARKDLTVVEGMNHMDGNTALRFVRERKEISGGDNARVANQQRVLKGMLDKAMSPSIITNYSKVLKAIDGSFETNMSSEEITDLIQMQLADMATWTFHSVVLEGYGKTMTGGAYMPNTKAYYYVPDQDSVDHASSLIKQMVNGEKIVTE